MQLHTIQFLGTQMGYISHVVFPRCWDVSGWQMVQSTTQTRPFTADFLFILKLKQFFLLYNCFSQYQTLYFPGSQFQCNTSAMTDIVLLVDGSWSIGRNNFKLIKEFLSNLISPFSIAQDKIRVGRTLSCFLTLGSLCLKEPWARFLWLCAPLRSFYSFRVVSCLLLLTTFPTW